MTDIKYPYGPENGKLLLNDGTEINIADAIKAIYEQVTGGMQPTSIQHRYAQMTQTHSGVTIAPTTWSNGVWIDANGYDRLAITLLNSAITNSNVDLQWSNDGSTVHGVEAILGVSNGQQRSSSTEIKARYFRFCLYNGDASPRTMSAWAYLKA